MSGIDNDYTLRLSTAMFEAITKVSSEGTVGNVSHIRTGETVDAAIYMIALMLQSSPSVGDRGIRAVSERIAQKIRRRYPAMEKENVAASIFDRIITDAPDSMN